MSFFFTLFSINYFRIINASLGPASFVFLQNSEVNFSSMSHLGRLVTATLPPNLILKVLDS